MGGISSVLWRGDGDDGNLCLRLHQVSKPNLRKRHIAGISRLLK